MSIEKPIESNLRLQFTYQGEDSGSELLQGVGTLQLAKKEAILSLLSMMEVDMPENRVAVAALITNGAAYPLANVTLKLEIEDLPGNGT